MASARGLRGLSYEEGRQALSPLTSSIGRLMGRDLSGVGIELDSELAEREGALGVARGGRVHLAHSADEVSSGEGLDTLVHELTHVAQSELDQPAAPRETVEAEAESVASTIAQGDPASVQHAAGSGAYFKKKPAKAKKPAPNLLKGARLRAALKYNRKRRPSKFILRRILEALHRERKGRWDAPTVQAIATFQKQHGLVADGMVGPVTMKRIERHLTAHHRLRYGLTRLELKDALAFNKAAKLSKNTIRLVQKVSGATPDGVLGPQTARATARWQRKNTSIPGSGKLTERTLGAMKRAWKNRSKWVRPCSGPVTSEFGNRKHPIHGTWRLHAGIDLGASHGSPIKAARAGRVTYAGWMGGYGNTVDIDHGGGLTTRYAHASSLAVHVGQKVNAGKRIGAVGSTGNSTGAHLHFELRKGGTPKNPRNYIKF